MLEPPASLYPGSTEIKIAKVFLFVSLPRGGKRKKTFFNEFKHRRQFKHAEKHFPSLSGV
jgi:hypothetical protein